MTEAPSVTVNPVRLPVEPGGTAEVTLELRNQSPVVDEYVVEVLGEAAEWTTLDRARVPTYPDTTETVRASMHPPRESSPPAGPVAVGFRIRSSVDPGVAVIEECQVDVKPFVEIDGEIKPTTAQGRFSASHRVRVINRGNVPVGVSIRAKVQQGDCDVSVPPAPIVVAAGRRATTTVKVRPSRAHWRGADEMHSYRLNLVPEGGAPVAIDAMMRQRPIARIPTAVLVALALLLGGAYIAYGKGPNPLQQMLQQRGPESASTGESSPTTTQSSSSSTGTSIPPVAQSSAVPTSSQQQSSSSGLACAVGTPSNVSATAGNGQVTVKWVAPAPTCAVTGFTITGSPGNITVPAAASAMSVVIPNLTDCTSYSFAVAAVGASGPGPGSPPTQPVTPVGPPGPPISVAAIAGDALVTLTWGSPSNTCGLQITNYVVQSSPAGGSVSVALGTTGGRATVTNLANDASYTFTVAAVTSAGMGPAAPSSAVTPRCTAINTLQLSVTRTLYWSARGTCSPYNGTIDEKFTSLFGVVTHKYLSFSAAGSNPAGSYYWYGDPPIATSHTTLYVTLTDSKGNTISSWIVYN